MLGWHKRRVTARRRILELPESAQTLVGSGEIPVAGIDALLEIQAVTGDQVARTIAANGIRLVLDEHRTTETPTLKSGQPGKTKVTYGEPEDALKWL